ncbi:hypothetical protein KR52_01415 [Synechococcus sp. KORDI-52]|nr:hypothetical protein KR52_01415 [Synechococcus sp. KORDI-52]
MEFVSPLKVISTRSWVLSFNCPSTFCGNVSQDGPATSHSILPQAFKLNTFVWFGLFVSAAIIH